MKKFYLLITILFVPFFIYSQKKGERTCTQELSGVVKNLKTGEIIPLALVELYDGLELLKTFQTDEEACFNFTVPCNKRFSIKAYAENYAVNPKIVFSTKSNKDKVWEIKLYPIREFKYRTPDKLIDVDNIEFVIDKPTFTIKSSKILDRVASIMEKYPEIRVSINVHTDSQGIAEYDLKMTQDRADTILGYLIEKGVDPERLGAIGFGSTQLLNNCTPDVKCSESQHRKNRRTEFVVL